ncbi:MAG: AAA family ATPase [Parvibaculaceae bacterium]
MIVSKLEISGFRGVDRGEIQLSKFCTLIGPNNCGKTTITEALALVLGRDRLIRPLTEHDFHGSQPAEGSRINIVATITDFEPNDSASHTDWFRMGRGTIKWLDSDDGTVKSQHTKPTDKLACQIAFSARFDHDALEAITLRYFYDGAPDPFAEDAVIVTVPGELIRRIGFFLVSANRTWDRTISFGSELFRRVVSYVGGRPAAAVLAERNRLRAPVAPLEDDDHLNELVGEINTDIAALLGKPLKLKLRVTTTDSAGILESVFPHFGEDNALPLPSRRHGSGLTSLQTLILLMRFGQMRIAAGDGFMMVIEEPELHVPPPLQRKLLRMMQAKATQTVITTHSPTVASTPEPHEIQIVSNNDGALSASPLIAQPLTNQAPNPIRSLLLTHRDATIYALMHPTILVPEGKTDAAWLSHLTKVIELGSSAHDEHGFSFVHEVGSVPTADARASEVYEHLRQIHPSVFCLFDGDNQGGQYTATVCASDTPPRLVVRWPAGWSIEDLIGWVVSADVAVLANPELAGMGIPQVAEDLVVALRTNPLKNDEVVHRAIADAMIESQSCRRRIGHVMKALSDLAMERDVPANWGNSVTHQNGVTTIWTFNHALPGV